MSLKTWHLAFALFLIMVISSVASGLDNLIIGGIWQDDQSDKTNSQYRALLNAKMVRTYYQEDAGALSKGLRGIEDFTDVQSATPWYLVNLKGERIRHYINPTDRNGLKDPLLTGNDDNYNTIYAHSGGARTAVTALLYQGVNAEKLVLIDPARGFQAWDDYKYEIQKLLDKGIDIDFYYYDAKEFWENPLGGPFWRGIINEGDFQQGIPKGNLNVYPVDSKKLGDKTGGDAHIQMWYYVLNNEAGCSPCPDQSNTPNQKATPQTKTTSVPEPSDRSHIETLQEISQTGASLQSNTQGTAQTTNQSPSAKFSVGAKVWVTTALGLHVRSVPGDLTNDPAIPLEAKGSLGTIQEGRIYANGFYWVKIKYDDGRTGWSAENWLELAPTNTAKAKAPANTEKASTQSESAAGDDTQPISLQVDQPVTPAYASQIPVGDTQTKHWSTANTPPGKVALSLDIRDKNGNTIPAGTRVTVKDGSGNYVQADWSSTGQTLAFGDPGDWIITVDAPGYKTNTQYVPVSSSSSSTSFRMNLKENGINIQPPASASKFAQAGIGTPLLSPESDLSSDEYPYASPGSGIGNPLISIYERNALPPTDSSEGSVNNDVNITVDPRDP